MSKVTAAARKIELPKQWPEDVAKLYDPVRELGRGRFATVVLARKKINCNGKTQDGKSEELHALKVVGSKYASKKERGYARREIEILSEISHPNIMRLIDYWEPPIESHTCVAVMALSYEKGPTLEWLLNQGGKLSLIFCRVVSAQLIDAVAYLHSRACVHRDIKPDNLVITGANESQDDIWDDIPLENKVDLIDCRNKWHVTLIDFGFARALTPEDIQKVPPRDHNTRSPTQDPLTDISLSRSRKIRRQMSAVGNRSYAAPEILQGVKEFVDSSKGKRNLDKSFHPIDVTETLSEYVSFYGFMADAYSVGNAIKHMLTGASPSVNVDEMIALEKTPLVYLGKLICRCRSVEGTRAVRYRRYSEIPAEALRLMKGMTQPDPQKRTTVSTARAYPWVDGVLDGYAVVYGEISYLNFVMKSSLNKKAKGTSTENDNNLDVLGHKTGNNINFEDEAIEFTNNTHSTSISARASDTESGG